MALTKYPQGSLRELCGVSFPLILFSFSSVLMFFLDRLFLAHYSLGALNAVASAGTLMWGFATGTYILASMADIFVAQYNGGGLSHRLGQPVWQMIWFSLFTIFFFIPFAYFGTPLFYSQNASEKMASDYFQMMMFAGPLWPLIAALSAFYIGQGRTKVIVYLVLIANLSNILLDWLLIFGIQGLFAPLGVKGAALSSILGQIAQVTFLFCLFLKGENRLHHGTGDWAFRPYLFWRCFRIGFPQALLETAVVLGWAAYYWIMNKAGEAYITIASITNSVYLLFSFIGEGIYKGAAAIVGNLIGAKQTSLISKTLRAGILFHLTCFIAIAVLLIVYPKLFIDQFLPSDLSNVKFALRSGKQILNAVEFVGQLKICLGCMLFYMLFENLSWLYSGILTAAGDTLYLFAAGSMSIWLFLITPIYYLVKIQGCDIWMGYLIMIAYGGMTFACYAIRYQSGRWQGINLIDVGRLA